MNITPSTDTTPSTRAKLLTTIAVLWLAAAIGIVVWYSTNPNEHRIGAAGHRLITEYDIAGMVTALVIVAVTAAGAAVVATMWTDRRTS